MYQKERRALKLEFLKVKDSEYTQFLLQEKDQLDAKNQNQIGGNDNDEDLRPRGINSSMAEDEEEGLDEDSN